MESTSGEDNRSRDHGQAEAAKVFVKNEAWDFIKKGADHNKGNSVTEGEAVLSPIMSEDVLSLSPHDITVSHNCQPRLHLVEKRQRCLKIPPVAKQRDRLADNIPCGPQCAASGGRFCDYLPGSLMVPISWIETGIEERRVAKYPRWECHPRLARAGPYRCSFT